MAVYSADSQVKNFTRVVRSMFQGLRGARYTAYRLCLKDVKAEYSRSKFGMFWDFLDPLVFAAIFFCLERLHVFSRGDIGTLPYVVFLVYGFLLYQVFVDSVTVPLRIMRKSSNLITHLKLAPECLLLSVFFRMLFNSSFRIAIMLLVSLVFAFVVEPAAGGPGNEPVTVVEAFSPIGFLKFVILFPTIVLAGMAIGVFLAPFNTIYNDVGRVTEILLRPLRFATPVMYELHSHLAPRNLEWIESVNPATSILGSLRSLATSNTVQYPGGYLGWMLFYLVLLMVGWFVFHVSIPVLADRA